MTAEEFKALFPEFGGFANSRIDLMLSQSELVISESTYGKSYTNAIAFHTAHLMAMLNPQVASGSGTVVSEKVGQLTTQYADPTTGSSDDFYKSTQYGQAFLELRKANVITALPL